MSRPETVLVVLADDAGHRALPVRLPATTSSFGACSAARRPRRGKSRLELARLLLADHDRNVAGIAAQPFQLIGPGRGRIRRHVPDFLLVSSTGAVTVVDVKTPAKLPPGEEQHLFEFQVQAAMLTRTTGHGDPEPRHNIWRAA